MGIVELLLTAIGLSMDAFAVSVCKGLGMRKMRYDQALVIGLYFGVFQALMPLLGWLLGTSFSRYIQAFDHWIAFVLLAFIGGKCSGTCSTKRKNRLLKKVMPGWITRNCSCWQLPPLSMLWRWGSRLPVWTCRSGVPFPSLAVSRWCCRSAVSGSAIALATALRKRRRSPAAWC